MSKLHAEWFLQVFLPCRYVDGDIMNHTRQACRGTKWFLKQLFNSGLLSVAVEKAFRLLLLQFSWMLLQYVCHATISTAFCQSAGLRKMRRAQSGMVLISKKFEPYSFNFQIRSRPFMSKTLKLLMKAWKRVNEIYQSLWLWDFSPPSSDCFFTCRYAKWLEKGQLQPLDLTKVSDGEAAWQLLRSSQPAHMSESGIAGQLVDELTIEQLVRIVA